MLGYIFVISCMTGLHFLCKQMNEKQYKRFFLIGTAILMTLFYGLRSQSVGIDTSAYVSMFYQDGAQPIGELWNYMWKEKSPAYVLSEWLFYQILPYHQLWLLATSTFFFFIFSKFVEKNSISPYFSYFIFFTIFGTFQMTGLRQCCAMAVLMLAYEQMKNKNILKYVILVILAYLFHKSAIVFLPFYIIGRRRISKLDIPFLATIIVVIYKNRVLLFEYIKSFTSYEHYEQLNHGEPINFSIMIYSATFLAILLCIFLIHQKKRRIVLQNENIVDGHENKNTHYLNANLSRSQISKQIRECIRNDKELAIYSQYTNAMILSSLFMPLVAINGVVRRVVMYFSLFMILLIPKAFSEFVDDRFGNILKILFGMVLLYLLLSGVYGSAYEYSMFFMGGDM